jgi:Cu2+-exporting ATPase
MNQLVSSRHRSLLEASPLQQAPPPETKRGLEFKDSFSWVGQHQRLALRVPDIRCAACSLKIESHLLAHPGVSKVLTSHADKRVVVDLNLGEPLSIVAEIESLGFTVLPDRLNLAQKALEVESKAMLARIGVAGIGMMQVMMFAFAGYFSGSAGIEAAYEVLLRWASLFIACPIALYSAAPFHLGALRDLRNRNLGMDVPVSIAILAAFSLSLINTVGGAGVVYFDSVSMFTFLLLIGRYVELESRKQYQQSQSLVEHLLPSTVRLKNGSTALSADVQLGMVVEVQSGEMIPVDGVVIEGCCHANEAAFTGESAPLLKKIGNRVFAGSENLDGIVFIEVTAKADEFVINKISELYIESSSFRPKFSVVADKVAKYFVQFILAAACLSGLYWYLDGGHDWFAISLTVLVVSCPCAFSLATPVAYSVAISALRNIGVIATRGDFLERLATVDRIVFDKTGTLTNGAVSISSIELLSDISEESVLELAAAIEKGSYHPIARAFEAKTSRVAKSQNFVVGQGVEAEIDETIYRIGRPSWVSSSYEFESRVGMWVLLGDDKPIALIQLADGVRDEAKPLILSLQGHGYALSMLTGDGDVEAQRVCEAVALEDCFSNMTPEQKIFRISKWQKNGERIAMIGDGINDAGAMGIADVSLAVSPVDVFVQESADATLLSNDISVVSKLTRFSRKLKVVIGQNIFWAVGYNVCLVPLAITGMIQPWMAALGMSLSSLVVILNANRLRKVPA